MSHKLEMLHLTLDYDSELCLEQTGAEIFIRKATFESAAFCEPLELTRQPRC